MDYMANKSLIESLLRSALTQKQPQSSNKNNIVLMNPEIHLHNSNEGSTSDGSTNNDAQLLIKKLQDELLHERQRREDEERRRHDENIKNEKLLSEKDFQIKNQNKVINRQIELLNEQSECLEKVYAYHGRSEQVMEPDPFKNNFGQRHQWGTSEEKNRPNNPLTNGNAKKKKQQRKRSKTTEPLELWIWDGMKWVMKTSNDSQESSNQQNNQNEAHLTRDVTEVQNKLASHTDVPPISQTGSDCAQSTHGINGTTQKNVPLFGPCKTPKNQIQREASQTFHLDDLDFTTDEVTFPTGRYHKILARCVTEEEIQ